MIVDLKVPLKYTHSGEFGEYEPLIATEGIMSSIIRHEKVFCHHLMTYIEQEFKDASFRDNFKGKDTPDFLFVQKEITCLVEAKSDAESKSTPWKHKTFQSTRDVIRKLIPARNDSRYARWIIFLAQLNYYAEERHAAVIHKVMLGLPKQRLEDAKTAISMLDRRMKTQFFSKFEYGSSEEFNVAYIVTTPGELKKMIRRINDEK